MKVIIKFERDQITFTTEKKVKTFKPRQLFSTRRLIIGDYKAAKMCFDEAAREMGLIGFFKGKHDVRIEVEDYFADGMSPIERQTYASLTKAFRVNSLVIELVKN